MQLEKDRLNVSELRERFSQLKSKLEPKEFLSCSSVEGGVPRGVICEVVGSARTEWTIDLLRQNPELFVFWAEEKLSILPSAFEQRGIDLRRVLMVEAGAKLFPTLRRALKTKLFGCVVLPGTIHEVRMLKALQLFARESNSLVCFLSKTKKSAWAIPIQLEASWIRGSKEYKVELLKSKLSNAEKA